VKIPRTLVIFQLLFQFNHQEFVLTFNPFAYPNYQINKFTIVTMYANQSAASNSGGAWSRRGRRRRGLNHGVVGVVGNSAESLRWRGGSGW
jgi:hypothetical protein